jgi:hypothetical protein
MCEAMASRLTRYIVKIRHLHSVKHLNNLTPAAREKEAEKIRVVMDALWDGLTSDEQLAARHALEIDSALESALLAVAQANVRAEAAEAKVSELLSQRDDDNAA